MRPRRVDPSYSWPPSMKATPPTPRTRQSAQMVWLIGEAFRCVLQASDEHLRAHGITHAQLRILYRLSEEPGLSGADLARRTFISPQAAYVALGALESKGLIDRSPVPDHHRIVRCEVTAVGHRVLNACLEDYRVVSADFGRVLDAGETQQIIDLLQRCLAAAGEPGSSPTRSQAVGTGEARAATGNGAASGRQ